MKNDVRPTAQALTEAMNWFQLKTNDADRKHWKTIEIEMAYLYERLYFADAQDKTKASADVELER